VPISIPPRMKLQPYSHNLPICQAMICLFRSIDCRQPSAMARILGRLDTLHGQGWLNNRATMSCSITAQTA
jgi:hypothetical protein